MPASTLRGENRIEMRGTIQGHEHLEWRCQPAQHANRCSQVLQQWCSARDQLAAVTSIEAMKAMNAYEKSIIKKCSQCHLEIVEPKCVRIGQPHVLVTDRLVCEKKKEMMGQIAYQRRRLRTKSGADPKLQNEAITIR
jgi:hypothetical protein